MAMRKYERRIAKDRMEAMHVGEANKKMGVSDKVLGKRQMKRMNRTIGGRAEMQRILNENPPMWKRVMHGDMAKAGFQAQMMRGMRITANKRASYQEG